MASVFRESFQVRRWSLLYTAAVVAVLWLIGQFDASSCEFCLFVRATSLVFSPDRRIITIIIIIAVESIAIIIVGSRKKVDSHMLKQQTRRTIEFAND